MEMIIVNEFHSDGVFWLPENPENQITGFLKFNPVDGGVLELMQPFDITKTFEEAKDIDSLRIDIILGVISGQLVTLYGCYNTGSNWTVPGFLKPSYNIDYIFTGIHFEKEEEIILDTISLTYTHLEDWVSFTGFKRSSDDGEYHYSYKKPDSLSIKVADLDISIVYDFNSSISPYEVHLKQDTYIKIEMENGIHFNNILKDICYPIQYFLSLGVGNAVYPLLIRGTNKNYKLIQADKNSPLAQIHVFYATKIPTNYIKKIDAEEMFFSLNDISDNLGECLINWFEKGKDLKSVYDLYFGTLYNPYMYLEHSFLSLIQAIESYHRRMHDGKYLEDEDYDKVYQSLLEAIPHPPVESDHYQSLKSRIYYGNEYSLRTRLKNLFNDYGDLLNVLIDNKNVFINDVVNLRNYWTHYDKSLEEIVKKGQERIILHQKLKFIIEVCFLVELGISFDKIKELIDNDQRYYSLKIPEE